MISLTPLFTLTSIKPLDSTLSNLAFQNTFSNSTFLKLKKLAKTLHHKIIKNLAKPLWHQQKIYSK